MRAAAPLAGCLIACDPTPLGEPKLAANPSSKCASNGADDAGAALPLAGRCVACDAPFEATASKPSASPKLAANPSSKRASKGADDAGAALDARAEPPAEALPTRSSRLTVGTSGVGATSAARLARELKGLAAKPGVPFLTASAVARVALRVLTARSALTRTSRARSPFKPYRAQKAFAMATGSSVACSSISAMCDLASSMWIVMRIGSGKMSGASARRSSSFSVITYSYARCNCESSDCKRATYFSNSSTPMVSPIRARGGSGMTFGFSIAVSNLVVGLGGILDCPPGMVGHRRDPPRADARFLFVDPLDSHTHPRRFRDTMFKLLMSFAISQQCYFTVPPTLTPPALRPGASKSRGFRRVAWRTHLLNRCVSGLGSGSPRSPRVRVSCPRFLPRLRFDRPQSIMKPIAKMIFVLRSRGSQLLPRCGLRELTPESVRRSPKPLGSWACPVPWPCWAR